MYINLFTKTHTRTHIIYIYIYIGCSAYENMTEICRKMDKSNTELKFGLNMFNERKLNELSRI